MVEGLEITEQGKTKVSRRSFKKTTHIINFAMFALRAKS